MMSMQARDATGRKVSLLNDDPVMSPPSNAISHPQRLSYRTANHLVSQPFHPARSNSTSPNTPELLRSDSYDSQTSNDPLSPLTPAIYDYSRDAGYASAQPQYDDYEQMAAKHAVFTTGAPRSGSYEDDGSATSPMPDRPCKRYPCRYRDSHGCEKTFTTSGHASRRSKIHTAEKAVQCTFHGCHKKFTRADNMKQHLETHYKEKSRSSTSQKSISRASVGSLSSAGRRSSSSGRTTAISRAVKEQISWEAEQYGYPGSGGMAPVSPGGSQDTWDLRGLNLPLMNRPSAVRTANSGLDALAMAVACQEGS